MSTIALDQPITNTFIQGSVPISIPLLKQDSNLSLSINAPEVNYTLEAPLASSPVIDDERIIAQFVIDNNVYLGLHLVGQSIEQENKFKAGQFFLSYQIEEQRPRAHFVANTLMAVMGLAGKLDLLISEPEISTRLSLVPSLLEISKMLHRRQTAYRLMTIEKLTGKRFLLPTSMSEREIETIAFVYHAIVDRSFTWPGGSLNISIPATQENASNFAKLVEPFNEPLPEQPLSETVLGQSIYLGRAVVTMEGAAIKNINEVRDQLSTRDGREAALEIHSRQDKYKFTEIPYSADISWEPKIQALINLEPYLDATITERYHALAAATLNGLTEEEKKEVTTFPDLDESFIVNTDGE